MVLGNTRARTRREVPQTRRHARTIASLVALVLLVVVVVAVVVTVPSAMAGLVVTGVVMTALCLRRGLREQRRESATRRTWTSYRDLHDRRCSFSLQRFRNLVGFIEFSCLTM